MSLPQPLDIPYDDILISSPPSSLAPPRTLPRPWCCNRCAFVNHVSLLTYCAACSEQRNFCDESEVESDVAGSGLLRSVVVGGNNHSRPAEGRLRRRGDADESTTLLTTRAAVLTLIGLIPEVPLPDLVNGALSTAVTGAFAVAGACTGAMVGAVAGKMTDRGVFGGAGLGLVAGAVVSVELLEAARAIWRSARLEASANRIHPIQYMHAILREREVLRRGDFEVDLDSLSYEEIEELFGRTPPKIVPLTEDELASLPCHVITAHNGIDSEGEAWECSICLQNLVEGETARSLPSCSHSFHLNCLDKWLKVHGVCPVCRQTAIV